MALKFLKGNESVTSVTAVINTFNHWAGFIVPSRNTAYQFLVNKLSGILIHIVNVSRLTFRQQYLVTYFGTNISFIQVSHEPVDTCVGGFIAKQMTLEMNEQQKAALNQRLSAITENAQLFRCITRQQHHKKRAFTM